MFLSAPQIQFLDAAGQGDLETVRARLAAGVDPNTVDDRGLPRNRTALMHAARNGHLDVVETLLSAGAKVDARDKGLGPALPGGNTALLLAMKNKHVRVAQTLLRAGANPMVKSGDVTVFGQAAYLGDLTLIRQLLKRGADPNAAISKRADLPLASALFAKRTDVVRLLLSAGANPNRPGRGRLRPLEIAIRGGLVEAAQLLLHHGADPNARLTKGDTPLMTAVRCGQKDMVKVLLQRNSDVNARTRRGHTPLDLAQQELSREVDGESARSIPQPGADVSSHLRLYQDIAALLRGAGARTGDRVPAPPRGQARAARASLRQAVRLRNRKLRTRSGVKDFLDLLYYTEPEFAVIAVRAALVRTAGALAEFRKARRWTRDVPRLPAARQLPLREPVLAVVAVKGNRWTVIFRSVFRLRPDDHKLAVEDAKELSARLRTTAIAFIREEAAKALGHHLFESGRLSEQGQWIEDSSICWFKSRFRRAPGQQELGEEFVDKIFRQQGIYLPACYPQYRRKQGWLCVEKLSARSVRRADLLLLRPGGKKRR